MKTTKFSYILQHEETGYIIEQFFTMEEIEGSNFLVQLKEKFRRYNIVARRQYTGLEDKNGKEIYEGDITNIGEVVFVDISAGFRINPSRKNKDTAFTESFMNYDDIEIIGNIYETPDLIIN